MRRKKLNREVSIEALQKAIFNLHGCKSKWVESVPIKEIFEGETVCEGVVQIFDLIDHPTAKRCYTWSHELEASKERRFFAVLHQGPIDSPQVAIKATIVQEFRKTLKKAKGG